VTNENDVEIENLNFQLGVSGDAHASDNTDGGTAQSGAVTNTSTSNFKVVVKN